MKIYLASSWRNAHYLKVLDRLRELDYTVYDFRTANGAFKWEEVSPDGMKTVESYLKNINDEKCDIAFANDMQALENCDVCVMVMPCGRSAHIEAGFAVGMDKPVGILYHDDNFEPDLMHKMANLLTDSQEKLESWLAYTSRRL
jgi:nucleoside 2-deoxyribosyltransferase